MDKIANGEFACESCGELTVISMILPGGIHKRFYNSFGQLIRDELITRKITEIRTYRDGLLQSIDDNPAVIIEYDDIISWRWYDRGQLSRATEPAVVDVIGQRKPTYYKAMYWRGRFIKKIYS